MSVDAASPRHESSVWQANSWIPDESTALLFQQHSRSPEAVDETPPSLRLRVAAVPNWRVPCQGGRIQCAQQLVGSFSRENCTLNQCGPRFAGESVPLSSGGIPRIDVKPLRETCRKHVQSKYVSDSLDTNRSTS